MPYKPETGVSILMPVYQLESAIAANIDRVAAVVADWELAEIIVIDDGSTDATRSGAKESAARNAAATVIGYPENRGKGGALKEGFHHSSRDTVVFLDADMDLPPEQLPALINEFERLSVDALVGAKRSAMVPGRYPVLRRILSVAFAAVNRLLFRLPIQETQTGLKVFKRSALDASLPLLQTSGYAFDLELLVRIRKSGGTLAEAPVTLSKGSSRGLSLSTLWEMGRDTLLIFFRSWRW